MKKKENNAALRFVSWETEQEQSEQALPSARTATLYILFMAIGSVVAVFCALEGMGLAANRMWLFMFSAGVSAYWYFLFVYKQHRKRLLTVGAAVVLVTAVFRLPRLWGGIICYVARFIQRLNLYTGMDIQRPTLLYSWPESGTTFLSMLIFLFSGLLAAALLLRRLRSLYLLLSLVLVSVPFFIGEVPELLPTILYVAVVVGLLALERQNAASEQLLIWTLAASAGFLLLLFCLCAVLVPQRVHEEKYRFVDTKLRLQRELESFSLEQVSTALEEKLNTVTTKLFGGAGADGLLDWGAGSAGLAGGELGSNAGKTMGGDQQLLLTVPRQLSKLYLKGYVGAVYTGEGWETLSRERRRAYEALEERFSADGVNAHNQMELLLRMLEDGVIVPKQQAYRSVLSFCRYQAELTYAGANSNFLYAPYVMSGERTALTAVADLYEEPKRRLSDYQLEAVSFQNNGLVSVLSLLPEELFEVRDETRWAAFAEFEEAYRSFVYEAYLEVPERAETAVQTIAGELRADSLGAAVNQVADYLSRNVEYTLNPGAPPLGSDYVSYFLSENHKGYCSHYASAAVLLLRALGYPARYIEGYIVNSNDFSVAEAAGQGNIAYASYSDDGIHMQHVETELCTVTVRDTKAHAWVEVYADGLGWIPVEVTAGYMSADTADRAIVTPQLTATPSREPSITGEENIQRPVDSPEDVFATDGSSTVASTGSPSREDMTVGDGNANAENDTVRERLRAIPKPVRVLLLLLACGAGCLGLLFLLRSWLVRRRARFYRGLDARARALFFYTEILRLLGLLGLRHENETETMPEFAERLIRDCQVRADWNQVILQGQAAYFSDEEIGSDCYLELQRVYRRLHSAAYEKLSALRRMIAYFSGLC